MFKSIKKSKKQKLTQIGYCVKLPQLAQRRLAVPINVDFFNETRADGPITSQSDKRDRPSLLKRFVDEGSTLLGHTLKTKEGRDIYANARGVVEYDYIIFAYDRVYNDLLDYAEKHSLAPDDARIIAWAMVQKALTDLIHEELSE